MTDVAEREETEVAAPVDAPEPAATSDEPVSRKDAIAEAWEQLAAKAEADKPAETPAPKEGRQRNEDGTFAKPPKVRKAKDVQAAAQPNPQVEGQAAAEAGKPAKPQADRPPVGWKPEEFQHWGKVPQEVKDIIRRQAGEADAAIRASSQARDFARSFAQVSAPYRAFMAAEGGNPLQSFDNYLRTAFAISHAPLPKAMEIIADAIAERRGLGDDVIQALDKALQEKRGLAPAQPNGAPPQQQQWTQPYGQQQQPPLDPRVTQALQQIEQQNGYAAANELETFKGSAPHADLMLGPDGNIRPDVAQALHDTIGYYKQTQGADITYEDAWEHVRRAHRGIAAAISQREEAERAKPTAAQVANKARRASVSLRPSGPVAGRPGTSVESRKDTLARVWDELSG